MKNKMLSSGWVGVWLTLCLNVLSAPIDLVPNDLVWRSHFIGTQTAKTDTNFAYLKIMWNLPQTQLLFQKAQYGIIQQLCGGTKKEIIAKLNGNHFFDQILAAESHLEVWKVEGKGIEWLLGIRQTESQAESFRTELSKALKPWQLTPQSDAGNTQTRLWALKKNGNDTAAFLARIGEWTVLYRGIELSHYAAFQARLKKGTVPSVSLSQNWFEFSANLPQILPFTGLASSTWLPYPLPCLTGSLSCQKSLVRTQMRLLYGAPQSWNLDAWKMPLHIMRDPLVCFTAVRNAQGLLSKIMFPGDVQINPTPNQFFIWAQADVPYQTIAAAPLPKVTNWIEQASTKIVPKANEYLKKNVLGEARWMPSQSRIIWIGLPVIVPSIYASTGSGHQFLAGDIFPAPLGTNLPPQELINQVVNQKQLLYYDWEITQERLLQLQSISQWYDILSPAAGLNQEIGNTNNPTSSWISAIAPFLGNSATEISVVSPQELAFKRSSHSGFTGIELLILARWLNDDSFPAIYPPASSQRK